ncbi:MAG TPA: NAD-dependent epimerase/dehydratase family protein [Alphaproteobacteria bacterium]|jgi:UDP-glucuronate 4-epimerase
MSLLITGAAGFIGMHVARALLARGETVIGVDDVNAYYDPALKEARLAELARLGGGAFRFVKLDIAAPGAFAALLAQEAAADRIVHLAAQAGVRYSLVNPGAYVRANVEGHFAVLEACRLRGGVKHLVYASSSSVYGGNEKLPFAVEDRIDRPVSLYAATKAADELMSHCYAHLYGLAQTGLRFFTVYGPWGRPDMSAFIFTRAILAGQPIKVFNRGDMRRDFTYIDDITAGVLAALDRPPTLPSPASGGGLGGGAPHRLYNLGNSRSEELLDFIAAIETALGKKAIIEPAPMQPGDVKDTYADIAASRRDLGFAPKTTIREGIPKFVAWYRAFYGV